MSKSNHVCHSLSGTSRTWCYIPGPHADHEALSLYQALEDLKTALRNLWRVVISTILKGS